MTNETAVPETDPTLAVAERQLVLLGELGDLAMGLSRAFAASAAASAKAEEAILEDKFFMPEIGRARACGAKDAAESFQKVSRAVRLTLKLQMAVAETVRDIRAGVVTYSGEIAQSKDAGETPAVQANLQDRQSLPRPSSQDLAGSCSNDRDTDFSRLERDSERLVEFERPETLPRAPFRVTIDAICADIGAAVDWTTWKVGAPIPKPSTAASEPLVLPGPSRSLNQRAEPDPEPAFPP